MTYHSPIKRNAMKKIILLGTFILFVALATLFIFFKSSEKLLQGYIEGDYVYVASTQTGRLIGLHTSEGKIIEKGNDLFDLDITLELKQIKEAEEQVEIAKHQLENIKTGKRPEEIKALEAAVEQIKAEIVYAKDEFDRAERLIQSKSISVSQHQRLRSDYYRLKARLAQLQQELEVGKLPARIEEIRAAEDEIQRAEARLSQVKWVRDEKAVKSNIDGMVTKIVYRVGDMVQAINPVIQILPPTAIKIRFFVPETMLGSLKLEQKVEVQCDGCPVAIPAKVSFISPTAEYTPPVLYTREWRDKLVFLVEAHPITPNYDLHPGQPVDIRIIANE